MISPQELAPESSSGTKSVVERSYDHAVVPPPEKSSLTNGAFAAYPPGYFSRVLDHAELLLEHAAEKGMDIDDEIRKNVLEARAAYRTGWNEQTGAKLLAALTTLAAQLQPVTAEKLLRGHARRHPVLTYFIVAMGLAILIVPYSLASFISSAISESIRKDIVTANDLAVKLTTQLGFPADQISSTKIPAGVSRVELVTELQTFAALIRAIYSRGRQLNLFIFDTIKDPYRELPPPLATPRTAGSSASPRGFDKFKQTFQLPVPLPSDLVPVLGDRILVYQDVRALGQDVIDDVSIWYGAMATCVLPVLYALLGACAYLLRLFAEQMRNRTYVRSHSARFLIAAIGGGVVGLFGNFTINQAVSVSPFAIAFLVGYSVDVFFSFLDGLINAFSRSKPSSPPLPGAP